MSCHSHENEREDLQGVSKLFTASVYKCIFRCGQLRSGQCLLPHSVSYPDIRTLVRIPVSLRVPTCCCCVRLTCRVGLVSAFHTVVAISAFILFRRTLAHLVDLCCANTVMTSLRACACARGVKRALQEVVGSSVFLLVLRFHDSYQFP